MRPSDARMGLITLSLGALVSCVSGVQAEVVMEWVNVGDVGNAPDTEIMIDGTTGYGSVSYTYQIGKFEVTNAQYIEFLNAVATVEDSYGLYNSTETGYGIERFGMLGNYHYGPKGGDLGWLNKPVNYVSWYDSIRFANWLHNGQPTGLQDASTTEDGAYDLSLGADAVRKPGAKVFLPGENEWYKAAYYKGGSTDAGYWDYATQSDVAPDNNPPSADTGNSTNHFDEAAGYPEGFAVGPPYLATDVGAYAMSVSGYGTYDQNGNMWEWLEVRFVDVYGRLYARTRGGGWSDEDGQVAAYRSGGAFPTWESPYAGIRLAAVPEPSTLSLLALGVLAMLRRRR